jgi:hypothetical protein
MSKVLPSSVEALDGRAGYQQRVEHSAGPPTASAIVGYNQWSSLGTSSWPERLGFNIIENAVPHHIQCITRYLFF